MVAKNLPLRSSTNPRSVIVGCFRNESRNRSRLPADDSRPKRSRSVNAFMKERPASEGRSWMWRRLRYAVQGFAPRGRLESDFRGLCGWEEVQEGIGKSAREWHFTLGER